MAITQKIISDFTQMKIGMAFWIFIFLALFFWIFFSLYGLTGMTKLYFNKPFRTRRQNVVLRKRLSKLQFNTGKMLTILNWIFLLLISLALMAFIVSVIRAVVSSNAIPTEVKIQTGTVG